MAKKQVAQVNVREMVAEVLKVNGFDGLFDETGDCGCPLGDLMPCTSEKLQRCQAGYKHLDEDGDWHIREQKQTLAEMNKILEATNPCNACQEKCPPHCKRYFEHWREYDQKARLEEKD
jgi:hypothetical protein